MRAVAEPRIIGEAHTYVFLVMGLLHLLYVQQTLLLQPSKARSGWMRAVAEPAAPLPAVLLDTGQDICSLACASANRRCQS